MRLPTLEDLPDVSRQRVLVRCDFNVPMADGRITDDTRIRAALPTLRWLQERGALVTACTHLGRPKGRPDHRFNVSPIRACLADLGPGVRLMDNLRFDPGEETNDPAFVERLVEGQDLYVNDAFGTAHRAHASVVGPPARLPSAAGRLLAHEVEVLEQVLDAPRRPFVAVLGGAKVSDKIGVVAALLQRVDTLLIGGGMCFTFLAGVGHRTGDSLVDNSWIERGRQLLASGKIVLPSDLIVARSDDVADVRQSGIDVADGWKGLDIGPESSPLFAETILRAGTVLWNGPMGMFEDPRFACGTQTVAAAVSRTGAYSVAGGGDTVAALDQLQLSEQVDHLSTGGGAMLEFVEHGDLPGLKALRESFAVHSR